MTKVILPSELNLTKNSILNNNLVIFPTETVYGLGANALSKEAVDKIYQVKNRASNNPLIVHLKDKNDISNYAYITNDIEKKLIDSFMPGPFTIILKKKDIIPNNVTCNMDTVGIRIPIDKIAYNFLEMVSVPIAAPSANLSTKPSGTKASDIYDEFNHKVDYIIDGGESSIGLESTVVKVINDIPVILRPGFITKEDIEEVIGKCDVSEYVFKEATGDVLSPGMLYKHYAPTAKCLLVFSNDTSKLIELVKENIIPNAYILGSKRLKDITDNYYNYGDSLIEIAHNIFSLLRKIDKKNPPLIIIEGVKKDGLGLAIMNRLIRTSSYNYIER